MANYPFIMGQYLVHTLQLVSNHILAPIPEHSHSRNSYEIHYIVSGYGILIANGSRYELSPGTLYITGPNIPHTQLTSEKDPMLETCIFYKFSPAPGRNDDSSPLYEKEQNIIHTLMDHPFWIGQDSMYINTLLTPLLQEASYKNSDSELLAASYLKSILILIARNMSVKSSCEAFKDKAKQNLPLHNSGSCCDVSSQKPEIDLNNQRYLIIDQAFLNHYNTITLDSLSEQVGLSKRQTQRLLKQYYGMDFNQKRLQARIAISKLLLHSTDKPIYEIAEQVGYSSVEHFCNVFKHEVGITALKYRRTK